MPTKIQLLLKEEPKPFFAERLEYIRLERNLTQKELAKELGISASMLSKYEKGKSHPNDIQLNKIAKYFNVSADFLLGNTNTAIMSNTTKDLDEAYIFIPKEIRNSPDAILLLRSYIDFLVFMYNTKK